jgi:GNAT superfamily N-acetyltransferase
MVRKLSKLDLPQIKAIDESDYLLYKDVLTDALSKTKYLGKAYGVFEKDTLVGYCTLNEFGYNGSVLSSVLIRKPFQQKGYGSEMVRAVVEKAKKPVYIECMGNQSKFYEKLGFKDMSGGIMIWE